MLHIGTVLPMLDECAMPFFMRENLFKGHGLSKYTIPLIRLFACNMLLTADTEYLTEACQISDMSRLNQADVNRYVIGQRGEPYIDRQTRSSVFDTFVSEEYLKPIPKTLVAKQNTR